MQTLLEKTGAYQLLKKDGNGGTFSHAYLLLFDDAYRLRTALKAFAKVFFDCAQPTTPAKKRIAELIDSESFADCVFFPTHGKKLVVEDAEKIIEESTLSPVEGEKKLFVIGNFSEANVQTQNKLLKLLEEPPAGVYFLLGATSAFSVLPTVLSRIKRLELLPFSAEEIQSYLQRTYLGQSEETLRICATAANGKLSDACAMVEGGTYKSLLDNAFLLLLSSAHKLPIAVKQVGETQKKRELLNLLRLLFREALLYKKGLKKHLLFLSEGQRVALVADEYSVRGLLFAQEAISEAEKQVQFNGIFSQCLEVCLAKIKQYSK